MCSWVGRKCFLELDKLVFWTPAGPRFWTMLQNLFSVDWEHILLEGILSLPKLLQLYYKLIAEVLLTSTFISSANHFRFSFYFEVSISFFMIGISSIPLWSSQHNHSDRSKWTSLKDTFIFNNGMILCCCNGWVLSCLQDALPDRCLLWNGRRRLPFLFKNVSGAGFLGMLIWNCIQLPLLYSPSFVVFQHAKCFCMEKNIELPL